MLHGSNVSSSFEEQIAIGMYDTSPNISVIRAVTYCIFHKSCFLESLKEAKSSYLFEYFHKLSPIAMA